MMMAWILTPLGRWFSILCRGFCPLAEIASNAIDFFDAFFQLLAALLAVVEVNSADVEFKPT